MLLLAKLLNSFAASVAYFENEARAAARGQALLNDQLVVRTQEAARVANRLQNFHATAEMVAVGIFEFSPMGKLVQSNDAWHRMSGYPRDADQAKSMIFMDLVYEEDAEIVMSTWTKLTKGVEVSPFEFRWKSQLPGGEPTWVLAACVARLAEDGSVAGIHACNTDISAQKKAEQVALQRADALEQAKYNEERFLRFTELAEIGVFILDTERQVRPNFKDVRPPLRSTNVHADNICQLQIL